MSNDFEKIPPEVWALFEQIIEGAQTDRKNRGLAILVAQGWNPPLLQRGSKTLLTPHGFAAYAWKKLVEAREAVDDQPFVASKKFTWEEADVPPDYRVDEHPQGEVWSAAYIKDRYEVDQQAFDEVVRVGRKKYKPKGKKAGGQYPYCYRHDQVQAMLKLKGLAEDAS